MSDSLESKTDRIIIEKSYDDPDYVEVKQKKADYEKLGCMVADSGDDFFPKQYFANPFIKDRGNNYTLDDFFPTNWKAVTPYEKRLYKTAKDLLENTNNEVSKEWMNKVVSGINPLHPFLEVGGALRTQVPLPMDMKELFSLIDIILNKNPDNIDQWKMPDTGLKGADKVIPTATAFEEGKASLTWKGEENAYPADRNILVWDDVAGSSGLNTTCKAPNFIKLLGSIIFQRSDEIAYDARGRYGAHVVRRLIDSHAYQNNDNSRTVIAFAYDRNTGFPYGYYAGLVSHTNVIITNLIQNNNNNTLSVTAPSLLLNYTFCMDEIYQKFAKTTWLLTAHLLAYVSKYVTGLPIEKHLLAIHTDKSAASKSTQKMMSASTTPVAYVTNDAVAQDIFKTINRDKGKAAFTYLFPAPNFAGLVRVDQSTVPLMDAGEEVPEPCDRFYKAIFFAYSELVSKYSADKISEFRNGKLYTQENYNNKLDLPSKEAHQIIKRLLEEHNFNNICNKYGLDTKEVIEWLKTANSLDDIVIGKQRRAAVLGMDLTISDKFPLNFGCRWEGLNTSLANTPVKLKNKANPEAQKAIFECIRFWAKFGNTANHYHQYKNDYKDDNNQLGAIMEYVPRLTDMGFIIVGSILKAGPIDDTANERAKLYDPNYVVQPMQKTSALTLFESNKENYLKVKLEGGVSDYNFSRLVQRALNLLKPQEDVTFNDIYDSIDELISFINKVE